ncbi:SAM-dependent methyltransferase [Nocardia sp. NPDC049220]|uniref:SAM-dependent methyltransferase n=1 Tax=Nocardia sp. NPDC049220 TaxID=3155273 RepID=UPI0033DCBE56
MASADEATRLPGVDPDTPSIARVYGYALGGADWFDVDRRAYEHLKKVVPHQDAVGAANRRWLERVVRYATITAGIDQILDLGSGLPTNTNTHEVAQELGAEVVVVYVDNDPMCVARGRELLEANEHTHFLDLDFTRPAEVMDHPDLNAHLDLSKPLLLMQCGTLHHVDDDRNPAGIMHEYVERLAPGSYAMVSHFFDPADENEHMHALARQAEQTLLEEGLGTGRWRTREEIETFFDGLELVAPGVVELHDWWPSGPALRTPWPDERLIVGGVGRKS